MRPTLRLVVLAVAVITAGCDNAITSSELLPPLDAASLDSTAGNWQMIVLSGPTQFTVAAPAAETSAAYTAELAAIKATQANLTAAQRRVIDYWSAGGVLRWNQIVRGLVAREARDHVARGGERDFDLAAQRGDLHCGDRAHRVVRDRKSVV